MLLPWLCDVASQEKGVLFDPHQCRPLLMDEGSSSVRRKEEVKCALHEDVQDIRWGRMSQTYCDVNFLFLFCMKNIKKK